jgi:phosphoribosylanthranilate isomerase
MKVKICGIHTIDEARRVAEYKPDAIGLLVGFERFKARNEISAVDANNIVKSLDGKGIDTYLLSDADNIHTLRNLCEKVGNSHLQVPVDVSPDDIFRLKGILPETRIAKVISITGPESITKARIYESCKAVDYLLLDSRTKDQLGGTGKVHDWGISKKIFSGSYKSVWLAGGLYPGNLNEAIEGVSSNGKRPYGVDVESGVETGKEKDYEKVRNFISIARSYD